MELLTNTFQLACSMCLGGASGEIAEAANVAIGLMLVFLILVLGSFGYFIFFLARKAKLAEEVHPTNHS